MRVKICGITRVEDALAAEAAGADAVGLMFAERSKRHISLEQAAAIDAVLGPFIDRVGVFMDAPLYQVEEAITCLRLMVVQLHGDENASYASRLRERVRVIKAFSFQPGLSEKLRRYPADAVLIDAPSPGGGKPFDWRAASSLAALPRLILAGGLTAANVAEAVRTLRPYAVDVSSGVESRPGIKSAGKIQDFVRAAKEAAQGEVLSTVIHSRGRGCG